MNKKDQTIVDEFHKLFYNIGQLKLPVDEHRIDNSARWLGWGVQKCPLDLWIYQEILFEKKPQLIIECGTANGGSGLFMAQMIDLIGYEGHVITLDIAVMPRPEHKRLTYLNGDVLDPGLHKALATLYNDQRIESCMVVLDDDHTAKHVYEEMLIYSQFVTPNQYLIVEDTNINGHPVMPLDTGLGGPYEAVRKFMRSYSGKFKIDLAREKFLMSYNPRGYLLRVT